LVLTAIANTTVQESSEFLAMYWPSLLPWALFVPISMALLFSYLWVWWRQPPAPPQLTGWRLAALVLLIALVLGAVVNKPWRKHHPMLFWPNWGAEVLSLRAEWAEWIDQREHLLARAAEQQPVLTKASPDTLVIVISDSINRGHLSLYGYLRETTPELSERRRRYADSFGVFEQAWSVDASTVPALRNFFYFGQEDEYRQHLLALASRAGYAVWWITNHDDLAINREHAQFANQVHTINRNPGRSSQSLDGNTLPLLAQALKDTAPRKLIVLHLLGAHPDYQRRHPPGRAPFHKVKDEVYQGMKGQGRSVKARGLRNAYDSAIHYHDSVVATSLDLTRQMGGKSTWVYFSDHGQEVGSVSNHAGHSATSADGYRVPLLVWGAGAQRITRHALQQPVRTDWLGHSVMTLLGIAWKGHVAERNVLDPRYQWTTPRLPADVKITP
jgi:heptose-I-phosphate ethanolaminephosphotransferase